MTLSEVIKLLDAGYTKAEIERFSLGSSNQPEPAAAGVSTPPAAAPEPAAGSEGEAPDQTPAAAVVAASKAQEQPETGDTLNQTLTAINETLKALQAAALAGDSRPAAPVKSAGHTLAEIISK